MQLSWPDSCILTSSGLILVMPMALCSIQEIGLPHIELPSKFQGSMMQTGGSTETRCGSCVGNQLYDDVFMHLPCHDLAAMVHTYVTVMHV